MASCIEANKELVGRFYDRLWNAWDFGAIGGILTPDIAFHGSLGIARTGHAGFIEYAGLVRAAFPDFHNTVEELIGEDAKVAALLTYRGTHRGPLYGIPPTGRSVEYAGVAIFLFRDGLISHGWVLGDRMSLLQQLGVMGKPDDPAKG